MATDTVITLPRRPKTDAERARAYRQRKRAKAGKTFSRDGTRSPVEVEAIPPAVLSPEHITPLPVSLAARLDRDVTPAPPVTNEPNDSVRSAVKKKGGAPLSSFALRAAALALAAVGLSMNAVYAHSLGSSDLSGWLFLALGVASDAAALTLPTVAAGQFCSGNRSTGATGWLVWLVIFAFAILGSVGFASTSISDTVTARASRVTPAVTAAQNALADAMRSRDLECKGGVGGFCREREAAVVEARHGLDAGIGAVAQVADPQVEAATRLVAWVSRGAIKPAADDFAMIRLALLSLLPQVGGILLMVSRRA
jgi:hypothetical protein